MSRYLVILFPYLVASCNISLKENIAFVIVFSQATLIFNKNLEKTLCSLEDKLWWYLYQSRKKLVLLKINLGIYATHLMFWIFFSSYPFFPSFGPCSPLSHSFTYFFFLIKKKSLSPLVLNKKIFFFFNTRPLA